MDFVTKSFRKDETLTSWTLLQHICPHFWAWLLNTIAITPKSEDKYFISVIWNLANTRFVSLILLLFLATLFSKYGPNICKFVILPFINTSLFLVNPGHSLAKICIILYTYLDIHTKWYSTTKVITQIYFSKAKVSISVSNYIINYLIGWF